MAKKKFYITTAIAYASGKPHIGNTYEIVLADSIARYKRFTGYDVRFQTGTDEHGQKIETKAFENFSTPKEFVDEQAGEIKRIWDIMNTSYDKFIRTTDEYHEVQIQKIFKKLYDKGDIYKSEYEGLYCTPCESFWTESQLVDGCCPDCGRPVKPAKEEAYFFKMSKYADRLIQYIDEHPEFIQPESRKNEMVNTFLKPGLQDLCVSRTSFKWGIPVDFDTKHVVYVWIDALSNYITGLGYDVDGNSDPNFDKYWPADLHLIGKDILRFHTIYWPIMLMALDLPLPKQVFGHPWLIQSDGKMSKSKGNVLYADDMVDMFGVDAVRYFVLHEMPFENDGVVSWELLIERINSDLANTLGNLVHRTISMVNKYFGGVVSDGGISIDPDDEYKKFILDTRLRVNDAMDKLRIGWMQPAQFRIREESVSLPALRTPAQEPVYRLHVRTKGQLEVALETGVTVCIPLKLAAECTPSESIFVEAPRIIADEKAYREQLAALREQGFSHLICHNLADIRIGGELGFMLHGGFGLNVTNRLTALTLKDMGLQDVCASIELRMPRIAELCNVLPAGVIVYGRLPMMLYRVCPIRSQEGCRKRDCFLTDRTGRKFPLLCSGAYQELVNSEILWLAGKDITAELQDFYFTDEPPVRIREVLRAYRTGHGDPPQGRTSGLYYKGGLL